MCALQLKSPPPPEVSDSTATKSVTESAAPDAVADVVNVVEAASEATESAAVAPPLPAPPEIPPDSSRTVIVLGAGAVGTCAALMLRRHGWQVSLIDRKPPGSETSGGNAGILTNSPAPFNSPALWRQLPSLLKGEYGVRLDWRYALRHLPWLASYFANATSSSFIRRGRAMQHLIAQSGKQHKQWLAQCGQSALLRESGWLKCYRNSQSFDDTKPDRALWDILGVKYQELRAAEIPHYLPAARPIFMRAVHLPDSMSVADPQKLTDVYMQWFCQLGGTWHQNEVTALTRSGNGDWKAHLQDGETISSATVVVALGPWSADFLRKMEPQIKLPMGFECGGHRHFAVAADTLRLPIADVDGGYVVSMQKDGMRMTSSVHFTAQQNRSPIPLNDAEAKLREAMSGVGDAVGDDWHGARPTTPDCLPLLGPLRAAGLWVSTAHQHVGLSAAPASGVMLADWMSGKQPEYAHHFHPSRYNL